MSSPNPVPAPITPSASTVGSGVGASLAAIVFWLLSLKGINAPAGIEAAVAGLFATLVGYLPKSGRTS